MKKNVPIQFINLLNNFRLFGNLQILFMKRLLLLIVLAFYCASTTAQEVKTIRSSQVMEVSSYLAYLKTSELSLRNSISNSNRLEQLLKEVQPALYFFRGEVKAYGQSPTSLYTDSSSLSTIAAAINSKETIEIVTIKVNQNSDLNMPIDLSVFSNFQNLKYIYILSTVETSGSIISGLVRNNNLRFGVFYKIDKGS
jgi:hypothetical protein